MKETVETSNSNPILSYQFHALKQPPTTLHFFVYKVLNKRTFKAGPAHFIARWTTSITVYNCSVSFSQKYSEIRGFFYHYVTLFWQLSCDANLFLVYCKTLACANQLNLHASQTKNLQIRSTLCKFYYFLSSVYSKNI